MKRTLSQAQLEIINTNKDADSNMAPGADDEGFMDHDAQVAHGGPVDVTVVGAGPSGLMLACNLVRHGIKTVILDDRPDRTSTGRADGMQPKTIETFKQLRLAYPLLRDAESTPTSPLRRTGRQIHYPDHLVGALDPYILLAHQGMLEEVLIKDIEERGVQVTRNSPFVECSAAAEAPSNESLIDVVYEDRANQTTKTIQSNYLIGCDGARSKVRAFIPGAKLIGEVTNASWGVLDDQAEMIFSGVIETDFPDLWSKTAVRSHDGTSILWIPRERNMTRLYVELSPTDGDRIDKSIATPDADFVEWFGNYVVGQRVANHFADPGLHLFIAGDAGHCHSALAAQGANTSIHDSFNLAWKLNLVIRDLAVPELLATYEDERRKIAQDLINFDAEHVKAFADGDEALARNFHENIRFIAGVGAEYAPNILNQPLSLQDGSGFTGSLKPGAILTPPTQVTRYIDANPVHLQLDIPMLSQFRIYIFAPDINASKDFLDSLCAYLSSPSSLLSRASARAETSYAAKPPRRSPSDEFTTYPERYTTVSKLFTYALVTRTKKQDFEISSLPSSSSSSPSPHVLHPLLQASRWTIYLDDITTQPKSCTETYLGSAFLTEGKRVAIVNVRPDGYVGSMNVFGAAGGRNAGEEAGRWVEGYYGRFLKG
ncbi:FAD binding domain-containing protein [Rasamsonia emersonii CBS 393.64]|uniref:FAD binding domain-containing protein n=1 Tax=Rasamsonia emersonii (strain ATCC 16479 / CBS 393.64 / IMI 116815) TaxID=1408163 RepID=A0A0F4YRH4_RASE3|nr:FAD binding domain-containing protein [Rasamsonia emersonii CBS 393.64]KKA20456.1 FAD binding domain-containing protein [Rasamsonia emersonii CBS 393.64]